MPESRARHKGVKDCLRAVFGSRALVSAYYVSCGLQAEVCGLARAFQGEVRTGDCASPS